MRNHKAVGGDNDPKPPKPNMLRRFWNWLTGK